MNTTCPWCKHPVRMMTSTARQLAVGLRYMHESCFKTGSMCPHNYLGGKHGYTAKAPCPDYKPGERMAIGELQTVEQLAEGKRLVAEYEARQRST